MFALRPFSGHISMLDFPVGPGGLGRDGLAGQYGLAPGMEAPLDGRAAAERPAISVAANAHARKTQSQARCSCMALLALCVFLTLSLLTYSPADPPSTLVYPQHAKIANACGRSGAMVAELLLEGIGLGAYFLIASLAVLDAVLLARRKVTEPVLRLAGWGIALLGLTTLLAMSFRGASPGPVIGPGGYLGAAGSAVLEMHFAFTGAMILTISLILAGLLLSTDYLLVRAAVWSVWLPLAGMLHIGRQIRRIDPKARVNKPNSKLRADDIDEAEEEEEVAENGAPAVRIRGKRLTDDEDAEEETDEAVDAADSTEEEAADDESEEDEEDDAAKASPPAKPSRPGFAARVASALRIRNLPGQHEREEVMQELEAASRADGGVEYELPPIDLLLPSEQVSLEAHEQEVRQKAKILEKTFASFGFKVKVVEIETGPVIAQYRSRARSRAAAVEDHEPGRRPGHRPARAERAHRRPDPRQEHGRHRSAQQRAAARPPARGDRGIGRQGQEDADSDLSGQRCLGQPAGRRSRHAAAPVDRRPHRHGQERLPQLDHRVDAHDAQARRGADADDRPEDGRAQPLQAAAAPDAPGRHRHAQGRGDPGLGRRQDGRALRPVGPGRRAAHRRLQPARRRRADGPARSRRTTKSARRFRSICRTS